LIEKRDIPPIRPAEDVSRSVRFSLASSPGPLSAKYDAAVESSVKARTTIRRLSPRARTSDPEASSPLAGVAVVHPAGTNPVNLPEPTLKARSESGRVSA